MPAHLIDVHSHPLLPSYLHAISAEERQLLEFATSFEGMQLPQWSVEQHLGVMDENGVSICILPVNSVANALSGANGQGLARGINQDMASLIAQHPNRFGAFAAVPMDDMKAAIEETTYALDVLKLDGVSASPQYKGKYLGEPVYDAWFAELDRRGATLCVHPSPPPNFDEQSSKTNVYVVEFMFETTRIVTTMVLSGAKQKFDKINVIATHAGGTIPLLAQRIVMVSEMPWAYKGGPKLTMKDTIAALSQLLARDRLLMSCDFAFMPQQTIKPAIKPFSAYPFV